MEQTKEKISYTIERDGLVYNKDLNTSEFKQVAISLDEYKNIIYNTRLPEYKDFVKQHNSKVPIPYTHTNHPWVLNKEKYKENAPHWVQDTETLIFWLQKYGYSTYTLTCKTSHKEHIIKLLNLVEISDSE